MNKLKVLGASVAMALLVASPATADTNDNGNFDVESEFLGTETVQFGGFSVESEFLFFNDGVFGNNDFDDDDFDD